MSTIFLKFAIDLRESELSPIARHAGPLFHRWLPDGEKDAITLETGDPEISLKIWFERYGFVDMGKISFSYNHKEIDPNIIPKQGVLDGGPLFGLLKVKH